jgi:hypothetical protein
VLHYARFKQSGKFGWGRSREPEVSEERASVGHEAFCPTPSVFGQKCRGVLNDRQKARACFESSEFSVATAILILKGEFLCALKSLCEK